MPSFKARNPPVAGAVFEQNIVEDGVRRTILIEFPNDSNGNPVAVEVSDPAAVKYLRRASSRYEEVS